MKFKKFWESNLELENTDKENKEATGNNHEDIINIGESDKLQKEEQKAVNKLIDDMGFSRYHFLIFTITALILICGGVQELMLAIVLSIIHEKDNLSEYHLALTTTSEYVGYTAASILVNVITNYLSNKRSIQIFTISTLIFTGVSIFSLNFYLTTISRFFIGLSLGIIDILIYLNLVESCPTNIRGFISSFILIFFPLGQFIISVICYFILDFAEGNPELTFRYLLLIPFLIVAVFLIILLPFIQDSARRMVAMHDVKNSVNIMKNISRFNKDDSFLLEKEKIMNNLVRRASGEINSDREKNMNTYQKSHTMHDLKSEREKNKIFSKEKILNENDLSRHSSRDDEKEMHSFKNQFQRIVSNKYLKYTIIFWLAAALTGFIFNGIFFMLPTTAPKLDKKTFKDVILSVSMEIPSNCLASFLIEVRMLGRLNCIKIGYFLTVLVCITCFIVGYDCLVINCLLKFFITIPANVLLVYSSEIYEGRIRTFGVSAMNFWKRLATISSPFVVTLFEYSFGPLGPYYLFGPFAIMCFIISILLHTETRGVPLDEIEMSKED